MLFLDSWEVPASFRKTGSLVEQKGFGSFLQEREDGTVLNISDPTQVSGTAEISPPKQASELMV